MAILDSSDTWLMAYFCILAIFYGQLDPWLSMMLIDLRVLCFLFNHHYNHIEGISIKSVQFLTVLWNLYTSKLQSSKTDSQWDFKHQAGRRVTEQKYGLLSVIFTHIDINSCLDPVTQFQNKKLILGSQILHIQ